MTDHQRGCQGREYTCTCGHDDKQRALIETLTAALVECEDYFDNRADADCDQDGFIPNEEMKMLRPVREALAAAKQEGF